MIKLLATKLGKVFLVLLPILFVVGNFSSLANKTSTGSVLTVQSVSAEGTTEIEAKALEEHECDDTEWHFVINQIDDESDAPESIFVVWLNGNSETVPLDKFTGGVAHYTTTNNLDSTVVSATTQIYEDWDGQFNLSHGPCDPGESPSPTPTDEPTATPTETPRETESPSPTPTESPSPTPTEEPTSTPTATPTLSPAGPPEETGGGEVLGESTSQVLGLSTTSSGTNAFLFFLGLTAITFGLRQIGKALLLS